MLNFSTVVPEGEAGQSPTATNGDGLIYPYGLADVDKADLNNPFAKNSKHDKKEKADFSTLTFDMRADPTGIDTCCEQEEE